MYAVTYHEDIESLKKAYEIISHKFVVELRKRISKIDEENILSTAYPDDALYWGLIPLAVSLGYMKSNYSIMETPNILETITMLAQKVIDFRKNSWHTQHKDDPCLEYFEDITRHNGIRDKSTYSDYVSGLTNISLSARFNNSESIPKNLNKAVIDILRENDEDGMFDYSDFHYDPTSKEHTFRCVKHGSFNAYISNHLDDKYGCCKHCRHEARLAIIGKWLKEHKSPYSLADSQDNLDKVNLVCKEHGIFTKAISAFFYGLNTWEEDKLKPNISIQCSTCAKSISKGEKEVMDWLLRHKIKFSPQHHIYVKGTMFSTRHSLEVDFFLPKQNIVIEYNGKQHYERVEYFHKTKDAFEIQQQRDFDLKEYCKTKGITLVEIPYTIKNVDKYLSEKLNPILTSNNLKDNG